MSFKYDQENSRIIHVKDEGQTACRIVRQAELTAECIEEVAEAVVKKMARPEPQREEMLVICDNCGHAIHVKGDIRKPDVLDTNVGEMIYRQAAIEAVSEACFELRGVFGRCEDALKALPSAQPKTGKWIDVPHTFLSKCSACEWLNDIYDFDYCPNCGADMRGEDETP